MQITELVLRNKEGCELERHEISQDEFEDYNLPRLIAENGSIKLTLEALAVGDTLTIEERWTERD